MKLIPEFFFPTQKQWTLDKRDNKAQHMTCGFRYSCFKIRVILAFLLTSIFKLISSLHMFSHENDYPPFEQINTLLINFILFMGGGDNNIQI